MRMFTTLRSKLLLTVLGFVLLAELLAAAAILHTTYRQTMSQARASIGVGERVLDQFMALRAEQLLATASILASDSVFKSAVDSQDTDALHSLLANFGSRTDADVAMLTDSSGQLLASVSEDGLTNGSLPFSDLLADARQTGNAAGLIMAGDRPYQLVLVPVNTPQLAAWAGMGFQIDQNLARTLASLTGLHVEFIVSEDDNEHSRISTFPSAPRGAGAPTSTTTRDDAFLSQNHVLFDTGDARVGVVLALERSEVLSAYFKLAVSLAMIFVFTLLLGALAAIWLGRKISEPVSELSRFAESVAAGQYGDSLQSRGIGELSILTDALSDMQTAVSSREAHMRHQTLHDPLTGLPNRESMRRILEQYFKNQRRFAAVRIAIHGFSRINGALGYQFGDQILQTVADRLRSALHAWQPLGRIEGNDFLVLIDLEADEAMLRAEIEQIRERVEKPIQLLHTPITLMLEVGLVPVPRLAEDVEAVWRRSVIARNHSREENGRTAFYKAGMDESRIRELTIIRDLAPALQNNELHLVYQPKMVLSSGVVRQVEALSRWVHPQLGPIPPDEFVGLAERSGQITLLTRWIVCRLTIQLQEWHAQGLDLGVALNLSADELADERLAQMVAPLLDAASSKQRITLEVTESALLRDPASALANLRKLQEMGARIAIDDFGAGYSSLAQLKQLGVDELKIDKSLVLNLDTTPADQFIVQMIIDLGHKMGLEVVVEGVENAATWRYLVEQGADIMQGYFLARPLASDALVGWVRDHESDEDDWCASAILGNQKGIARPWKHLNS